MKKGEKGNLPILTLRKPLRRAVTLGHPWIYRDALKEDSLKNLREGFVELHDREGFLAYGIYDPTRPIAVRIVSRDQEKVPGEALFYERIVQAVKLRRGVIPEGIEAYRLIHGEADGLAGVAVDRYGEIAVLRSDGPGVQGMVGTVARILEGMKTDLGISALLHRRSRGDTTGPRAELIFGKLPPLPIWVREYGVWLEVNPVQGQKTGLFLDQRENRRRIAELKVRGPALNLFAYNGGFGISAVKAGAEEIIEVDISEEARESSLHAFARNRIETPHTYLLADLFSGFPEEVRKRRYPLIILDPPSLAPNEKSVPRAKKAYLYLLTECLKLLDEGGILAASSCSSHISRKSFLDLLVQAGGATGRSLRILGSFGAGPDHPILPAFPEGDYLKFFLLVA